MKIRLLPDQDHKIMVRAQYTFDPTPHININLTWKKTPINMDNTNKINSLDVKLLRLSLGIIYFWFGALKFFPDLSPAQQIAMNTIESLSFQLLSGSTGLILLASWEVLLGLAFIMGFRHRFLVFILLIHLIGTFSPLVLFPSLSFRSFPYGFTLLGQYIVKNLVFVAAAGILWNSETRTKSASKR